MGYYRLTMSTNQVNRLPCQKSRLLVLQPFHPIRSDVSTLQFTFCHLSVKPKNSYRVYTTLPWGFWNKIPSSYFYPYFVPLSSSYLLVLFGRTVFLLPDLVRSSLSRVPHFWDVFLNSLSGVHLPLPSNCHQLPRFQNSDSSTLPLFFSSFFRPSQPLQYELFRCLISPVPFNPETLYTHIETSTLEHPLFVKLT